MIIDPKRWKLPQSPSFIAFEGVNGAGKSTLMKGVADFLSARGQHIVQTREPGGTDLGVIIRKVVQETPHLSPDPVSELLLFSADRAEHVRKVIRPALQADSWVLSDRYFFSSMVFQGYGRGMSMEIIDSVTRIAIDGELPGLVVLVDLPVEEAMNRLGARDGRELGAKDRFEREGMEFHQRIRDGFLSLAKDRPEPFLVLDGMLPRDMLLQTACGVFS